MRAIFFLFISCIIHAATSQNSIGTSLSDTRSALHQFNSKEYESVIQILSEAPNELDQKYLVEMSRISLGISDPANLQGLITTNPKHHFNTHANFTIGTYYFDKSQYLLSERSLKQIDGSLLTRENRMHFYFMRGYLDMENKTYKSAQNYFQRASTIDLNDDPKLSYYQGFIAYHLDQKELALSHLNKVKDNTEFGTSAKFFLAKMQLEQKRYSEVIALAQSELSEENSVTNSAFNQLIGEAYALQGEANKASNYFSKAITLHPAQPSAALYYQAGVASFKINLKKKAIEYFTEAGIRSGEYAQLSAFQLGRLYVASDDKVKAVAAYVEASVSSDAEVREESIFKAGKLFLDQKNYSEGIKYLQDYLVEFDEGKWKVEAEGLLAEAYLRTSNYDQAINHLLEIGVNSNSNKAVYQQVTFRKAHQLFNDTRYIESIRWFNESLRYPVELSLKDDAFFNLAEAHFNLSNFQKAIESYLSQSRLSLESFYGLGYAFFNLGEYNECIEYFQRLLQSQANRELKNDAELRLADAYYATKNYQKALSLYQTISRKKRSTYVTYQIGIVNRNLGQKQDAITAFEQLLQMEEDSLADDAIFQIAQLQFESAAFERAAFFFTSLISKYPDSNLVPGAYLNRAISRNNLNKLNESRRDFEYILNNHINSKVAFNAILGLQEIQGKGIEVGRIQEYINRYRNANPDDESLEVIEFEFAKSQYFNLKYDRAADAFKNFFDQYPISTYQEDAKYYLADSYYRNDQLEKARASFSEISQARNKFSGRVYSRLGDINFRLTAYDSALNAYTSLVDLNLSLKDNYLGQEGRMKTYFAMGNFDSCLVEADKIITADWKPLNAERNARLIKAKSYLRLGDRVLAEENLSPLSSESDRISAEASFLLANFQFDEGNYEESLESLFEFNSKFGSYQDLIDQSYLLIANNYIQMKELFQAKATLRSIIQHSGNEEVKSQAQNQLSQIENLNLEDSIINKQ